MSLYDGQVTKIETTRKEIEDSGIFQKCHAIAYRLSAKKNNKNNINPKYIKEITTKEQVIKDEGYNKCKKCFN